GHTLARGLGPVPDRFDDELGFQGHVAVKPFRFAFFIYVYGPCPYRIFVPSTLENLLNSLFY
ncbi:hypothetical protein E3A20_23450, partial [Planctomyces bekefii]